MNTVDRKNHLDLIRQNLSVLIKEKKNFTLRDLSRKLKKNDAYLQQYISRGSPAFLPEEERKILSDILNINKKLLTPIWLEENDIQNDNLYIIKHNSIDKEIKISLSLLENYNFSNIDLIKYDELKISNNENQFYIKIIFDRNITNFVDNNFYLLQDKEFFFLAYLLREENNQTKPHKLIVKPYETKFRPFRIDEEKLTIYSKILFLGCLMRV